MESEQYGKKASVLLISLLVFSPIAVLAGRPLSTEDAGLVEPGVIEMEEGIDHIYGKDYLDYVVSVKTGVTDRLDFGVSTSWRIPRWIWKSLRVVELSMKFALIEKLLSVSVVCHTWRDWTVSGVLSRKVGPVLTHINLGVCTEYPGALVSGAAVDLPVGPNMQVVGEGLVSVGESWDFDIHDYCLAWGWETLVGMSYSVSDVLALDIGAGWSSEDELKATVGTTYSF